MSSANASQSLNQAWQRAVPIVTSGRLAWLVIGLGAAMRAAQYFANSALYVDEGALALNIINRSFEGLLQPLDFNQAAPAGFMMLEKVAVLLFGDSEYALRLFPFLFSIAALFLFYAVARRVLTPWAVPVAVLFFSVSEQVIYYSAQVKQYSSDVAATLLVLLVGLRIQSKELTAAGVVVLALTGAVIVWLSHPSVFVLAGVGTTLMLSALKRKQWLRLWKLGGCCAIWLLSFIGFYLVSLSDLDSNQRLETSWMTKGTFMPLPPASLSDLDWFVRVFFNIFSNPGDSPFPVAAGLMFVVGCAALLKERRTHLLILISPILFTLLASGLHKYPFGRRLLLFCVPLMLILIVAGGEFIIGRACGYSAFAGLLILEVLLFQLVSGGFISPSFKRLLLFVALSGLLGGAAVLLRSRNKQRLFAQSAGAIIFVFLLLQPVGGATNQMFNIEPRQDIRPIMSYVHKHRQPGDLTYVYHHQLESFLYYAPKYGFGEGDYVFGKDHRDRWRDGENEAYQTELDRLRGNARVWFLFSHVRSEKGVNEEGYITQYLGRIGKRLDYFKRGNAAVYLFDLHDNPAAAGETSNRRERTARHLEMQTLMALRGASHLRPTYVYL